MINEQDFVYSYEVNVSMFNGSRIMKPSGYQTVMNDVAEMHLKRLHLTIDDLSKFGMAWVLISASFDIINPVCGTIRLQARTWHSEQKGLTFRRDIVFTDESGKPLFNAVTYSVLLDLHTRKIVRPVGLPFDPGKPHKAFAMEASSRLRNKADMSPCDRRRIYPSFIDSVGHTNNCRYGEFVYDAFNEQEIDNLINMSRMDMYFISELKLGDYFIVRRGHEKDGSLLIDGLNENTGKESFACRVKFK